MKLTIKTKQINFELDDPKGKIIEDIYDLNRLIYALLKDKLIIKKE